MYPVTFSLDGEWEFFYSPLKFVPETDDLPVRSLFTGKMVTPGYWDDHLELFDEEDFFGLTARFNPDYRKPHFPMGRSLTPHASSCFLVGTGFYCRDFDLSCFKPGDRAVLTVGPSMWGCSVFCNGVLAGKTTGYSVSSSYDVTDLLVPEGRNTITIAVDNVRDDGGAYCRADGSHDGIPFGTRPGQHRGLAAQGYQSERGGIGGGVSLKISRQFRIADAFISYVGGCAVWHAEVDCPKGATLHYSLKQQGVSVAEGSVPVEENKLVFDTCAPEKLWSDRAPELCDVELALECSGTLCDKVSFKWGAVSFVCSGTQLEVNGRKVYLRGATEHCYFPETANPHFDKEKYLRDLGVLKDAGFNFIRCHTWCPPEPFYDACDELGIFVQTEFPSVYTFDEVRDILRMIRRHTCAVIVCEGNEKYIDESGIDRLREVCRIAKEMIPQVLFNPQEAIRGVEYGFLPGQKTVSFPFEHDAERFSKIAEFSDLYGSLGGGYFSYSHDEFPGVEQVEEMHSIYGKPCLSHEIGILGGYLDFSLEQRYAGTFIGTDLFAAARENMLKHGVYQFADTYYKYNTLFISSVRKQLVENIRSCPSIAGYDYLGAIDTHWHLVGYPCGIFNEFYEEKYGESIADVAVYNGESILISGRGKFRNITAGRRFENDILLSFFGDQSADTGSLEWSLSCEREVVASGSSNFAVPACGSVSCIGKVAADIPPYSCGKALVLDVECLISGEKLVNSWKFWAFPEAAEDAENGRVRSLDRLSAEDVEFLEAGGRVLLTGNFPAKSMPERFAPHTSGRSIGHSGALIHPHPVWEKFPHEGFADWQFYMMMTGSESLVSEQGVPEYAPVIELIPSFKLIKRKSLLSEYQVGKGRLMISGLRLDADDPAAAWMKHILIGYLGSETLADAPAWDSCALKAAISEKHGAISTGQKIDAGGRPTGD
ncbi:MAG: hypothetical protein J6W67_07280 [Lentisphaeria bacterium]|nr:hypothetical protein [Lentisphaeria bacterium]